MPEIKYRDRRAMHLENDKIRVTVLCEGGHVAEILHKGTGVNPLWTPPWPTIEPSTFSQARHPEYGADAESRLLSGIMGHNVCIDLFGGPSAEEAAAGITVHGEASVNAYSIGIREGELIAATTLYLAQLQFERRIRLDADGQTIHFAETVQNLSALDRPIAWTQHVTLGPPFVERGLTSLRCPGTKSKVYETEFGEGAMKTGAVFDWPLVPLKNGGMQDLQTYTAAPVSAGYTTHLMDPHREHGYFVTWSPTSKVAFGYKWKRADFPWLGIWEENCSRTGPPWNGKTVTRGLEFGASPMPETRRQMIERKELFGVPAYRWLPAKSSARVEYSAFILPAESIPEQNEPN